MRIKFIVNTDPHPQFRPYTLDYDLENEPEYIKAYKEEIRKSARVVMGNNPPTSKPVGIYVAVCRTKDPDDRYFGDIDNHLKIIFDTLKGICYTDDRLIREVESRKYYSEQSHLEIIINDYREEFESKMEIMNQCTIYGFVVKEAEKDPNGFLSTRLVVAVKRPKNKAGDIDDKDNYVLVNTYGSQTDKAKTLKKGDAVLIQGWLKTEQTSKGYVYCVVVDDFQGFIKGFAKTNKNAERQQGTQQSLSFEDREAIARVVELAKRFEVSGSI